MKLNVTLDQKSSEKFEQVKKHFGVTANQSVIAFLISQEYGRIERSKRRKVFLPKETYDRADKAAASLNLTIDEYVDSVTEQLLKNPKEARALLAS